MKWLLEPEVYKEDEQPLIDALKALNVPYVAAKFGTPYEKYIEDFEGNGIFHGSLQFGKRIKKHEKKNIAVYCDLPKYECTYYYPRFGEFLLNNNYIMLPIGDLERRFNWIMNNLGTSGEVFIRPNSGYKTFTGDLVGKNDVKGFVRYSRTDPQDLILVSSWKALCREWRLVVVNNKVVTGGQYKEDGEIVRKSDVPEDVLKYGQYVLERVKYNPDPAWTLDVCETADRNMWVLETNSFSCAGLYACDYEAVVREVNNGFSKC
jgi:hypothetical protein